ncbi:uncharacterized protein LOC134193281 [Corticium candelabrum]|uniref:uncharacterized protein LOC134193281 n=1 Tax=Corticium candelabrum TaxID=121492 RepID=UPI002E254D15|nr:uncharacterized protein LOC134193281 [Corticium candelabrum]
MNTSKLSRWMTFLNERAPPIAFFLLSAGPVISSQYIFIDRLSSFLVFWTLPAQLLILLTLRIMDDVKDYDKDVVVHPDRPLPRKLLQKSEVELVIRVTMAALLMYSVVMVWGLGWSAAVWFAAELVYSLLMYIEFGIGETLDTSPIVYAITHQLFIYVGAFFLAAAAGISQPFMHYKTWQIGHLGLSGFFTFEICRKLDPDLPKLKGTYLIVYGRWKTLVMTGCTVAFGIYSSFNLGLSHVLWPIEFGFLGLLTVHFVVPLGKGSVRKRHKLLEGLAFLYVLLHLWGPAIISRH